MDASSPLADTLARLAPHGAGAHAPPHPPGPWRAADRLAQDDDAIAALLAQVGAEWRCERRDVQAMRVVEVWAWTVAFPAAAAILLDGRLPDVRAANVLLAHGPDAPWPPIALRAPRFAALPGDAAADHADVTRLAPDRDALARELHAQLTEAHLAPLVERAAALTGRARRALWRGAGDRVAQAFVLVGDALGQPAAGERLASGALAPGAPLPNRPPVVVRAFPRADGSDERVQLRDGCCLYYHVPDAGEHCLGCPLLDDEARAARVAAPA
jgi:hypothetical protein